MQVRNGASGVSAPAVNSIVCARDLMRRHGFCAAFYRGLQLTILRETMQYSCYFYAYREIKSVPGVRGGGEGGLSFST